VAGSIQGALHWAPSSTGPPQGQLSPRRTTLASSASAFPIGRLLTLSPSEYRDQRTQFLLGNERCCPPNANPLGLSLMAFGPCLALAPDQERKHSHPARYSPAADSVCLLVRVGSDGFFADDAADARFLITLSSRNIKRLKSLYWPALGNYPTLCLTRGHQQQLDGPRSAKPIRQGTILNERRSSRPSQPTPGRN